MTSAGMISMTKVVVHSGICGFTATIEAKKTDKWKVSIKISSDCDKVTELSESLTEVDALDILRPKADFKVYAQASEHSLHMACPVPVGILKAVEVETGLALPCDAVIHFETVKPD